MIEPNPSFHKGAIVSDCHGRIWALVSDPYLDNKEQWKVQACWEPWDSTTRQERNCTEFTVGGKKFHE